MEANLFELKNWFKFPSTAYSKRPLKVLTLQIKMRDESVGRPGRKPIDSLTKVNAE